MTKINAWDLYHSSFKKGDEVIIVDDEDKAHYGKIVEVHRDSLFFKNRGMRCLDWLNIRFMANYGFPIKELHGADGSSSIELLDTSDLQKTIRLNTRQLDDLSTLHHVELPEHNVELVIGDPYLIENVEAKIVNTGNSGWNHWLHDHEESLVLIAKDGAMGLLYDIPSVYFARI